MRWCLSCLFYPYSENHDYYDLPIIYSLISATTLPFRRLIPSKLDIEVGRHGSHKGDAFARAFLDYLAQFKLPGELAHHLDEYYTAKNRYGKMSLLRTGAIYPSSQSLL